MRKILLFVLCLSVFACEKPEVAPVKLDSSETTGPIIPEIFDWENVDYVPTGNDVSILMPWANGANALYDPQIKYDFRKSDGWKMLYNTFRTDSQFKNGSFFGLYNQYRGILRFYTYIKPNSNITSNYLEENFVVNSSTGATSSIWNFANQTVIDPQNNALESRAAKNFQVPSEGGWYVSEIDIAYDPNLANLSYRDLSLAHDLKFWSVENTTLSGTINGTAKNVSVHTKSPFKIGDLIKSIATKPLAVKGVLSSLNQDGISSIYEKAYDEAKKKGIKAVMSGISNFMLTGNPNSGSTQTHLKIDLKANFSGQNTSQGAIKENFQIALPGTSDATNGVGNVPADNEILGIFNLPSRPTVMVSNRSVNVQDLNYCLSSWGLTTDAREYTFYLNNSFLKTLIPEYTPNVYNPKFLEVADVTHGYFYSNGGTWLIPGPKLELLVGMYNYAIPGSGVQVVGHKDDCNALPIEYIDGIPMRNITPSRTAMNGGIIGNGFFRSDTPVYLRISFEVIPRDGSPRTMIVKTFKCNVSPWM